MSIKTEKPLRTGLTDLSDDELLLLDALFDMNGLTEWQLSKDYYRLNMNVPYSHALTSRELHEKLESWKRAGLMYTNSNGTENVGWNLTKAAGLLWEQEREPIWDRYIQTRESIVDEENYETASLRELEEKSRMENPVLTVFSPMLQILEEYLEVTIAFRKHKIRDLIRKQDVLYDFSGFSYKSFSVMHVVYVPTMPELDGSFSTNWEEINKRRTWWQDVSELDIIRRRNLRG